MITYNKMDFGVIDEGYLVASKGSKMSSKVNPKAV